MMRTLRWLAVAACISAPIAAQNTDIQSVQGLQFNFSNPGARSLGMGGAFLGLADDASAAEANPAGLTILAKREISIEVRYYGEQQVLPTAGMFPDIQRTAFKTGTMSLSFASFVMPVRKNLTVGVYYHEPLRDRGAGEVLPTFNRFSGALLTTVPHFFLPRGGPGPVSKA